MNRILKISVILGIFMAFMPFWVAFAVGPTPYASFSVSPQQVYLGSPVRLTWTSFNTIGCTLSGGNLSGGFPQTGTATQYPTENTTYTLFCQGYEGGYVPDISRSITVINRSTNIPITGNGTVYGAYTSYPNYNNNPQPNYSGIPTVNLYASKSAISAGEPDTLTWTTANASSCYAQNSWSGYKNTYGTEGVYPVTTSTYTLTCNNGSGSNSASVTIYVNAGQSAPSQGQQSGLGAACSTSPDVPRINGAVTFSAVQSGGVAPYSYSWTGDVTGTNQSISRTFSTTGTKTATVRISDGAGRTTSGTCTANVLPAIVATPPPPPGQVQGATTPICKTVTICMDASGKVVQKNGDPIVTTPPPAITTPTSPSTETVKGDTNSKSFMASIFNVKPETWTKIKSLLKWYLAILAIILLVVLSYFGVKKFTGKEIK